MNSGQTCGVPVNRVVRPSRQRAGGFTLIEVLISLLITTIGILALAALLLRAWAWCQAIEFEERAQYLLVSMAETFRAQVRRPAELSAGAWQARAAQLLPGSELRVIRLCAHPCGAYQIELQWQTCHLLPDALGMRVLQVNLD